MKAVVISMKNSGPSPEELLRLAQAARSGAQGDNADLLLKKALMERMTPEQSRQLAQIMGDRQAMESILSSEQAQRLLRQLKKK